jgi:hypothetical protein
MLARAMGWRILPEISFASGAPARRRVVVRLLVVVLFVVRFELELVVLLVRQQLLGRRGRLGRRRFE